MAERNTSTSTSNSSGGSPKSKRTRVRGDSSTANTSSSQAEATSDGVAAGGGTSRETEAAGLDPQWLQEVNGLRYQDARTALELAMAQLQAPELEVEEMADLYRRAEAYAERCAAVLEQVEQDVVEWEAAAEPGAS